MAFSQIYDNFAVATQWQGGAGPYLGLKDGKPWSGESGMGRPGFTVVNINQDGSFWFEYPFGGGKSIHQCRVVESNHVRCNWSNTSTGASTLVDLYSR
jgi:hypothetical protein